MGRGRQVGGAEMRRPRPGAAGRGRSAGRAPARRRASSQRTSAWPPFSCGRMYGTCCSVTVDRPAADQRRSRRRSGYVSCGPVAEPSPARSSPGTTSRTVPTRAQVGQLGRDVGGLLDVDRAASARAETPLVRDDDAGRRPYSLGRRSPRPVAFDGDEPPLELDRRPGARQRVGDAADPVVVGRRAPQRTARRRGEQRVDEPARRRRARRASPAIGRAAIGGRGTAAAEHGSCGQPTSNPAGAQAARRRSRSATVSQASRSSPASPAQRPAGERDDARLARPERRQRRTSPARPASPSTASSQVARSQPRSRKSCAVDDLDEPGPDGRAGPDEADRRGDAACAPTSPASAGGPATPGRRCRSCRRSGSSPKSPPYAQRGRPSGSSWTQAVVPELPDEAALQPGRRLDRVPVLGQGPVAVAHRVRVLAHDQRVALRGPTSACADDRRRSAGTSGR